MPDSDRGSTAWRLAPSAYLATRPPAGPAPAPRSSYVTMRDGGRLAVDVYLPPGEGGSVPSILILTPYYCVRPDGAYHQRREDPSRQMSVWSGS
jgi:uncharacterized protein